VTVICGTAVTDTTKLQVPFWLMASVAVQVTVVSPMGNADPDAGSHTTVTGGCPFCGTGTS
jgi:hypothetical protein